MAYSTHTSKRGVVSAVFGGSETSPSETSPAAGAGGDSDLPALSGLKTAELEAVAKNEGVDLSGAANNDERRALIEKARKG